MRKAKRLLALLLIACGISSLIFFFSYTKYFRPRIISISQKFAENKISNIIDREVKNLMLEEFLSYDKITIITRNSEGNVTSISANSVLVNNFANNLDIKVGDMIEKNNIMGNSIYLSSLVGFDIFAGMGPKVPIRFQPVSVTHADITHTFEENGINQTLHTIMLVVSIDIEILLPLAHSNMTVKSEMPIAQTLIVGNVPDAYFNKK